MKKSFKWIFIAFIVLAAYKLWLDEYPSYPTGWRRASLFGFKKKGPCIDIEGSYNGVEPEFEGVVGWAYRRGQTFTGWDDHYVVVTQADDGSWIDFDLRLSENGIRTFLERTLKYNSDKIARGGKIHLQRGNEYSCNGRWIENLVYPQDEFDHGAKRLQARFGLDGEGNLVASESTSQTDSWFRWADVSAGKYHFDQIKWRRWLKRTPEQDAELEKFAHIEIRRYAGLDKQDSVTHVKLQSYLTRDVCVRVWNTNTTSNYPDAFRTASVLHFDGCPENWYYLKPLNVLRVEMHVPSSRYEPGAQYRVKWYPVGQPDKSQEINIADAADLPLMPNSF